MRYLYSKINSESDEEQRVEITGYKGTYSAFEKVETETATFYIYECDMYRFDPQPYIIVMYLEEQPVAVYETEDSLIHFLSTEGFIDE